MNNSVVTVVYFLFACIAIALLGATIHGLVLAFSASIILGIAVLLIEPAPLIIGLCYWITGVDLAQRIVEYFSK